MECRNRSFFYQTKVEIYHILCEWPFWVSTGLTVIICLLSEVYITGTAGNLSVWKAMVSIPREQLTDVSYCAEIIFSKLNIQRWFVVLLPVLAGFPSIHIFFEEWFGGGYFFVIIREGRYRYASVKAVSAAICGGVSVFFGVVTYVLILYWHFPSLSQLPDEMSYIVDIYGGPLGIFTAVGSEIGNIAAVAAMFPILSLILMVLLRQKFLALTIPMMVQYLSDRFTDLWYGTLWKIAQSTGDMSIFEKGGVWTMLFPSNQLGMSSTFTSKTGLPMFVYYIILFTLFLLFLRLFYALLERRVKQYG